MYHHCGQNFTLTDDFDTCRTTAKMKLIGLWGVPDLRVGGNPSDSFPTMTLTDRRTGRSASLMNVILHIITRRNYQTSLGGKNRKRIKWVFVLSQTCLCINLLPRYKIHDIFLNVVSWYHAIIKPPRFVILEDSFYVFLWWAVTIKHTTFFQDIRVLP